MGVVEAAKEVEGEDNDAEDEDDAALLLSFSLLLSLCRTW